MKKKIFIALACIFAFPVVVCSQNAPSLSASDCIADTGSSTATLSGDVDSIIGWTGRGDVSVGWNTNQRSVTFSSTGYGKGCITVRYMAKGSDSCSCASSASIDVYKRFDLPDTIEINGPACVSPGQTVVYSIDPIVTKNINDRIGIDGYYWNIDTMVNAKNSFVESVHYTSGDSSSVTFTVKDWDDNIGPNEISVIVGKCNHDNPAAKRTLNIMKQAPKPDFGFDQLCIPYGKTPFTLTILNASSNVEYTWAKSPDWEFLEFNEDSTSVTVLPNVDSPDTISVSAVYKNNIGMECATTKNVLQIHRRWGETVNVTGPQCVIAEGPQYRYSVTGEIPRRTQVRWEFPTTWVVVSEDNTNQYIDAYPSSNAPLTSEIRVYELSQCESSESRYVPYFVNVKPAPVNLTGAQCVNANTQYLYTITRKQDAVGPDAQQYALYINGYFKRNFAADTVNVTIADTIRFMQVQPLGNNGCNGDFSDTLKMMISPTPPASITWENNHCIAAGMEDSVILSVSNAVATQTYTWDYTSQTHNWSLKRYATENHSTIVLYTTGQAGPDSVAVYIEGICGETERKKIGFETDEVSESIVVSPFPWGGYAFWCDPRVVGDDVRYTWIIDNDTIYKDATNYGFTTDAQHQNPSKVQMIVKDDNECAHSVTTYINRGDYHAPLQNNKKNKSIQIVPNPTNTSTVVKFPEYDRDTQVMLFGQQGQLVYTTNTSNSAITIETNSLPDGTYPIIVTQGEDRYSDIILIQH